MEPNDAADRRLTRLEAATFLSTRGFTVAPTTLSKYAVLGGGPPYEKFGRRPLYTERGLLAWVASKTGRGQRNTSDQAAPAVA